MTLVKFCGVTRSEDVRQAVRLGVAFLGLNFVPVSPRYIEPAPAAELVEVAGEEAARLGVCPPAIVGVFAGAAADEIRAIAGRCGLDYCQWCGPDDASLPERLDLPVIVAYRPRPGETVALAANAWGHLLDGRHEHLLGGTGLLADWEVARGLAGRCRLFLAGGLRPENVGEAVRSVRPYAVDVAGGIEERPGAKDHRLMQSFVEEVNRADGNT